MKFGTDGVSGIANSDLTASFALDLGRSAARILGGTEAIVGGDTRVSTAMLEAAFVAGLASEGVVVHRLGVVPTPVVAFEAARRGCLGAMISASHNPYRDNGIKLFDRGGTKLPDALEERIEADVVEPADADEGAGPVGRRRGQPGLPRPPARAPGGAPARRDADRRRRCQRGGERARPDASSPAPAPTSSPSTTSPTAATSTRAAAQRTRPRWRWRCAPTAPTSDSPSTATPTG